VVQENQTGVSASGRGLRVLLALTDWASYLVLAIMVLVVCVDLACRALLGFSIQIAEEISSLGLVCLMFLSLAGAFHEGGFLRIDALFPLLPPLLKRILEPVFLLIGIAVTAVYIYYLAGLVGNSFAKNIRSDTALGSPNFLTQSVMVAGFCALAVVLVAAFVSAVRAIPSKETDRG